MIVSSYLNFGKKILDSSILDILNEIKSEKYISEINSIRYALHQGNNRAADEIKRELKGFTASGIFGTSRTKEMLLTYSKIICLDFDNIPKSEILKLKTLINNCKFTFASFISPSGEGLKIFIKVSTNAEEHTIAYIQVANFYKDLSGYDFDAKCKDITRLCFVSSDSELYLNEKAEVFDVRVEGRKNNNDVQQKNNSTISDDDLLDECLKFTEQKENYHEGNRNNFVFLFSCNANKFGISENDTLNFCLNNFDLNSNEVKATVKNVYKNQIADFAKFAKFANMQNEKKISDCP